MSGSHAFDEGQSYAAHLVDIALDGHLVDADNPDVRRVLKRVETLIRESQRINGALLTRIRQLEESRP